MLQDGLVKLHLLILQNNIKDKKDFEIFLEKLRYDFHYNKDEWENKTLKDFLESLQAYTVDIEGYYRNQNKAFNPENPTWQTFAQILIGAKVYE